jgi:hypothetical protein
VSLPVVKTKKNVGAILFTFYYLILQLEFRTFDMKTMLWLDAVLKKNLGLILTSGSGIICENSISCLSLKWVV